MVTVKAKVQPNRYPAPGPMGNTQGLIVNQTEANTSGGAMAPPIKPTAVEKTWWGKWGQAVHTGLNIVGAIPVVGIAGDAINAAIYTAEGDYANAAISGVSAAANLIPGGGAVMKGGKLAVKGAQAAVKAGAKQGAKQTAKEIAEATAKKAAKEAEEAAAKKAKGKDGGKDKGKGRCILRPFSPDTCAPRTGHHVVPDRVFRIGKRGSPRIPGGITEAEGLVICVEGKNASRSKEHGQIHAIYDPMERVADLAGTPVGTTSLGVLEAAGALSAGKVTGCNPIVLEMQLRAYHQAKGLGINTSVRADPTGKLSVDATKIGTGKTASGGPKR